METLTLPQVPTLVDLSGVDMDRRAGLWASSATSFFPGVSISDIPADAPVGQMQSIPMGAGSLWSIRSPAVLVSYSPAAGSDESSANISLLLQIEGVMFAGQNHRACHLGPGDMCLMDERFPFYLQGKEASQIVFLRMPRRAVQCSR